MNVELIDHMGSDLSVVNAARVSFDKESDWLDDEQSTLEAKDERLISYLAKHNHWSPFAHCFASFRIKAPIFVARQLVKHQVGLAWNEVSRRYVDSEPEFYTPETWRKRADNVKQGSLEEEAVINTAIPYNACCVAVVAYNNMLKAGVCPEQARMVLPQSMMTEWIWSGSLMAFARVCQLRLDNHTQKETREVAALINDEMKLLFPVSWKALQDG